jgi:hypothetical protein
MAPTNRIAKSPPEAKNGDMETSGFVIVSAELFRRMFAESIERFPRFFDKAGMLLGHGMMEGVTVYNCCARIDETADT